MKNVLSALIIIALSVAVLSPLITNTVSSTDLSIVRINVGMDSESAKEKLESKGIYQSHGERTIWSSKGHSHAYYKIESDATLILSIDPVRGTIEGLIISYETGASKYKYDKLARYMMVIEYIELIEIPPMIRCHLLAKQSPVHNSHS